MTTALTKVEGDKEFHLYCYVSYLYYSGYYGRNSYYGSSTLSLLIIPRCNELYNFTIDHLDITPFNKANKNKKTFKTAWEKRTKK